MFPIAIDVQTLRKDTITMSPAPNNSKAEFTKMTFANMAEKGLGQSNLTGVIFLLLSHTYVASPCYERL